jgi:hypothetical protein
MLSFHTSDREKICDCKIGTSRHIPKCYKARPDPAPSRALACTASQHTAQLGRLRADLRFKRIFTLAPLFCTSCVSCDGLRRCQARSALPRMVAASHLRRGPHHHPCAYAAGASAGQPPLPSHGGAHLESTYHSQATWTASQHTAQLGRLRADLRFKRIFTLAPLFGRGDQVRQLTTRCRRRTVTNHHSPPPVVRASKGWSLRPRF